VTDYSIVKADEAEDAYAGSDVPGEFRSLGEPLETEQLAVTLIRVPPHSDFDQGTGHHHEELEEVYIVSRGTLTMRFGEEVEQVAAGSVVRVAADTTRSHRNEGDEPVEVWAVSRQIEEQEATKIEGFWEPSSQAAQRRD
jgi:mannose-6-phosphate isomerase-like protein (cupin superfamily)